MSLFEDYFITGRIVVPGGAFFSTAGMPTEAFLIAVMQGTNSDGINNDGDGFTDEDDEADPNFRTVGDGDRYDAGATVENIKGIFEKAVLTGGDHNNTLVVNDSDNTVFINGQSLTRARRSTGSALLDNRGNTFDTNVENYVVSILPGNSTRVDIVDCGGGSGVDRIVIFGTSQADSLALDGAGSRRLPDGHRARHRAPRDTFVTFRGVERAEVYTLGGARPRALQRHRRRDRGRPRRRRRRDGHRHRAAGARTPATARSSSPTACPVADTQNMTNGNSHPLFVLGDGQNDRMEVNHNRGQALPARRRRQRPLPAEDLPGPQGEPGLAGRDHQPVEPLRRQRRQPLRLPRERPGLHQRRQRHRHDRRRRHADRRHVRRHRHVRRGRRPHRLLHGRRGRSRSTAPAARTQIYVLATGDQFETVDHRRLRRRHDPRRRRPADARVRPAAVHLHAAGVHGHAAAGAGLHRPHLRPRRLHDDRSLFDWIAAGGRLIPTSAGVDPDGRRGDARPLRRPAEGGRCRRPTSTCRSTRSTSARSAPGCGSTTSSRFLFDPRV